MRIILASKSPRRKELLGMLNLDFEVIVSEADETLEEGLTIEEQAKRLSFIKAKTVFDETTGDRIVIGSDTMVIKDSKIYGKPKDREDAYNMLKQLQGTKHQAITGLAILVEKDGKYKEHIDYDISNVFVSDMTNKEIEEWIKIGEVYDKAGAYAIQSKFGVFVDKIEGNYSTVIGFPINKVYKILKQYI